MYEPRHHKLLPFRKFLHRVLQHALFVLALLCISLFVGMAGYVYFEKLPWIDAFVNAAMLLGGMGPVNPLNTFGGKLFAGLYAMYAGLVVIAAAAVLFAPFLHRLMHALHWKDPQP